MIEFNSNLIPVNSIKTSNCGSYTIEHITEDYYRAFFCTPEDRWFALGGGSVKDAEWLCNLHADEKIIPAECPKPFGGIGWKSRLDTPPLLDGDKYLMAVACVDAQHQWYWETACVTIKYNEYSFDLILSNGLPWDFDWTYVEYWMPLTCVTNLLPVIEVKNV